MEICLNEKNQTRQGEEPVLLTDQLALHHDIAYRNADRLDPETALQLKHDADQNMVKQLDQVQTTGIIDKFSNFTAKKILQLKLKLGMSINPLISDLILSAINISGGTLDAENAEQIAGQLHNLFDISFLDEIWACDLMDFSKDHIYHKRIRYNYMLVIIDCFSKFCWCFMIKQQIPERLINCYEQLFNDVKPEYMWWDMEKAVDSNRFSDFFKDQGVTFNQTYSAPKYQ